MRSIFTQARKQAVLALFLSMELAAMTVSSQGLVPHHVGGDIRVTAPSLHFLTGKSLSQLHDGAAVPFDFQLIITWDRRPMWLALWNDSPSATTYGRKSSRWFACAISGAPACACPRPAPSPAFIVIQAANLPAGQQLSARLEIRRAEIQRTSGG